MNGWSGDWAFITNWVRGLYPPGVELNDDEDDVDTPSKIEIHGGTRIHIGPTGREVDCSDYDEPDVVPRVRAAIDEYLAELATDKSTITIKLVAFRLLQGDEIPWEEKNNAAAMRTFQRQLAPITTTTPTSSPVPPVGGFARVPAAPSTASPVSAMAAGILSQPTQRTIKETPELFPIVDPQRPLTEVEVIYRLVGAAFHGFQQREEGILERERTILAEHRFLIDHLAQGNEKMIAVLKEAVTSGREDNNAHRDQINKLMGDSLSAQVKVAENNRAAELARASTESAHMKAANELLQRQLEEANKRAAERVVEPTDNSMTGRLTDKVANTAGTLLDTIVKTAVEGGQQQQGQQQTGGGNGGGGNGGGGNGAAGGAAGLLDLLKDPSARKIALAYLAKADPEMAATLADDLAGALDTVVANAPAESKPEGAP